MILTDSEVGSLKAALSCWEWVGYVSTAIVFLGCVGEFIAEFTSVPKNKETASKLARLSLIVLIFGIAGELLGVVRTSQLSGQIIANIEVQAAQLRKDAEELEKAVSSRRLTGEQKEKFAKLLKQYPDPVGVVIVSAFLDSESSDFADDFDSAFHDVPWKTLRVKDRLTKETGLSLGVLEGTPALDPWNRQIAGLKKRIGDALTAIGVEYHETTFGKDDVKSTGVEFKPGPIYLVIEHHPPINVNAKARTANH